MANPEHLALLRKGKTAVWEWVERTGANLDLYWADLSGMDLSEFPLMHAYLSNASLRNATLRGADLCFANLAGPTLPTQCLNMLT